MSQNTVDIYNNWYVMYVTTGKELFIKNTIERYLSEPIWMTIFQKEMIHTRRGKSVRVYTALFSGYIFIHKRIEHVVALARKLLPAERITMVSINKKPCMVFREEMEVLINNTDSNGMLQVSLGKRVNDAIQITHGALKNFQGKILWIDEKRRKAKVEINLFKRKIKVNLGIDFIDNAPMDSCA